MQYHRSHTPYSALPASAGLTEVPIWTEATRVIILTSNDGVRQWRVEGLASNVTPTSLRLLADLLELAEDRGHPVSEAEAGPRAAVG